MFIRNIALVGLSILALAACHSSFGHRNPSCSPNLRLDQLLDLYDRAKKGWMHEDDNDSLVYDCDRVRNDIERLALEFPRHARILLANAAIAYEASEPEKASAFLVRVFAVEPSSPEAAVLKSRIVIDEGNVPAAKRLLTTQLGYRPDHAGLHEAIAAVMYLERDIPGARAHLAAAEKLNAPSWRIAYHRGLIAEATGDASTAQREFQRSLDENPAFAPARARLDGSRAQSGYNQGQTPGKTGGG